MVTREITIKGKVHGVFYRASAKEKADALGLAGWVKNEQDGTVTIQVQGHEMLVQQMIDWCWQGPARAKVDSVEVKNGDALKMTGFRIIR